MSKERIDLTYFEGITENRGAMNYEIDENGMVGNILGIEMNQKDAAAIYNIPKIIAELKKCYEEIDLLREYAKCVECSGQYLGPMDYGLHEWDHSEDCVYASE